MIINRKRKFIIKSFLLLSVYVFSVCLLNTAYIFIVEKNKQIFRKEHEWQQHIDKLPDDTLNYAFFGDSHTRDGLNPKFIGPLSCIMQAGEKFSGNKGHETLGGNNPAVDRRAAWNLPGITPLVARPYPDSADRRVAT